MDMWTLNARRYRDAGANVGVVELMNEPAYMGESEDHHAEFESWLRDRYGSIAAVNRTWGTDFATLREAAVYRFRYERMPPAGQRLDYDEYMSDRFGELIAEGIHAVSDLLPNALVGVQPMGGYPPVLV
jgi:beta-galactosidase GanA